MDFNYLKRYHSLIFLKMVLVFAFVFTIYQPFQASFKPIEFALLSTILYFIAYIFLLLPLRFLAKIHGVKQHKFLFKLFAVFLSLFTIGFLLIGIGYKIGTSNWGAPVNYVLLKELLLEYESFIGIFSVFKIGITDVGLVSIGILTVYMFNFYIVCSFVATYLDSIKSNLVSFLIWFSIGLLIAAFSFYLDANKNKKGKNQRIVKYEILSSFFIKNRLSGRNDDMEWGTPIPLDSINRIEKFEKKNVIIFSVDCLRADHLSFRNYKRKTSPFLDSLQKAAVLKDFKIMTSSCSNSFGGILTILNSKDIQNQKVFKLGIQDYLKMQGYRINFLVSGMHTSYYNLRYHYGKNVDFFREGADYKNYNNNDDYLLLEALDEISNYTEEPNFFFFHLMSPHVLGEIRDTNEIYKPTFSNEKFSFLKNKTTNEEFIELYRNQYDNGVYQSDDVIKKIVTKLKTKGYLENSIIIITGDHGESLGEHNRSFGHSKDLYQSSIGIPIIIIDKDTSIYKEQTYASQIDIGPTIVSRLGLPIPKYWDGRSLTRKSKFRQTFHEQTPSGEQEGIYAVIVKENELILKYMINKITTEESFFDLNKDPNERVNRVDSIEDLDHWRKRISNHSTHQ